MRAALLVFFGFLLGIALTAGFYVGALPARLSDSNDRKPSYPLYQWDVEASENTPNAPLHLLLDFARLRGGAFDMNKGVPTVNAAITQVTFPGLFVLARTPLDLRHFKLSIYATDEKGEKAAASLAAELQAALAANPEIKLDTGSPSKAH